MKNKEISIINVLGFAHNTLNKNFSKFSFLIYFFLLLTGLFYFTGIFSVIPLVTVLVAPEIILENDIINSINFFDGLQLSAIKYYFAVFFLIMMFLSQVLTFMNNLLFTYISNKISFNMRSKFYENFLSNKLNFFATIDLQKSGIILSSEIDKIGDLVNSYLNIVRDILILTITVTGIIIIDFKVLFFISLLAVFFVFTYLISRAKIKEYSVKDFNIRTDLSLIANWFSAGFKEILIFKLKKHFLSHFKKLNFQLIYLNLKKIGLISLPKQLVEIILYLIIIVYFLTIKTEKIIVSEIPFYCFYFLAVFKCVPIIFSLYRSFSMIQTSSTLFDTIPTLEKFLAFKKPEVKSKEIIKSFKNNLKVEKVEFNYPQSEKKFKFDYIIKKNAKVLISGKSGSGKTTLVNLISGLIKPNIGLIKIDGTDIDKDLNGFLSIIGYVSQTPFIFADTLATNISLKKNLKISDFKKLKKIFQICGLENIYGKFENSIDTKIKSSAPELSGGQRQRISLARVLFKNPQILIIDEGLNALDQKSEKNIMREILKNFKEITIIYISHRPIKGIFKNEIKIK